MCTDCCVGCESCSVGNNVWEWGEMLGKYKIERDGKSRHSLERRFASLSLLFNSDALANGENFDNRVVE